MQKEKIKSIATKLKVDELLVMEALNNYCSPYGNDNPETYAYIQGVKDGIKRTFTLKKLK